MIPNCQSRKVQDCGSHLPAPQRWSRTCQMVWDSPVQAGESLLDIVFGIQYQGQNRYYIFYSVGSTLYLSIKESWQIYQVNTCSERFGRLWWKGKERKKPFFFFSFPIKKAAKPCPALEPVKLTSHLTSSKCFCTKTCFVASTHPIVMQINFSVCITCLPHV